MMKVVSVNTRRSTSTPVFDTHTLVERREVTAEQIRAGEVPYEVRLRLRDLSSVIDRILSSRQAITRAALSR